MTEQSIKDAMEWIAAFVSAGNGFGCTCSLQECIVHGVEDGDIHIFDDLGIEQPKESRYHEDAYLIALHRLVKNGEMELAFRDPTQQAICKRWLNGKAEDADTRVPMLTMALRYIWPAQPIVIERTPKEIGREFLLAILKSEENVRYCRFYDGTTETEERLAKQFGVEVDSDESPACIMDDVVWEFVQKGIVTKTNLPEKLSDGENDYLIELTEKGRESLKATTTT